MATNDSIQGEILPIADRKPLGLTSYDAKDPETKFLPTTPLRPPTGAPNVLFILPQVSVDAEQKAQPRGLKEKIVEKKWMK